MKRKLLKWMAAIVALAALLPAHAQMGPRHRPHAGADAEHVQPQARQQEEPLRELPSQEPQQSGRMSPEERRQLRRDIHEAGRELYRRNPQRPLQ